MRERRLSLSHPSTIEKRFPWAKRTATFKAKNCPFFPLVKVDNLSLCYLQPTFIQMKGNIIVDRVRKGDLGKRPSSSEKIYSKSENTKQLPPDLVKKGAKQQEKEHKQLDLKEEEQMWKQVIEPKNVDISKRTKLVDALRPSCMAPREHRPERVNKTIELFNKTVQEIKDKLDADYLPKELKDEMVETTLSLISEFKKCSDQAVQGYGNYWGKGGETRNQGEEKITSLNKRVQDINAHLPDWRNIWEYISKLRVRMNNASFSVLNDAISHKEQIVLKGVIDDFRHAHKKFLHCYSSSAKSLETANMLFRRAYNQLKGFHEASYAWMQAQEIQKDFIGNLSDSNKEKANKLIGTVKEDYNQLLVCYGQGKDWEFSKQSVEARYEWLADTVKDDLCKKWNEHYSSYKQLLERAGGQKNPEIDHIVDELSRKFDQLFVNKGKFDQLLDTKKLVKAKKYVDQIANIISRCQDSRD